MCESAWGILPSNDWFNQLKRFTGVSGVQVKLNCQNQVAPSVTVELFYFFLLADLPKRV